MLETFVGLLLSFGGFLLLYFMILPWFRLGWLFNILRHPLRERKHGMMLRIVNRQRRKRGLGKLKEYYYLDGIARRHSLHMARRRTCNHMAFNLRADRVIKRTGCSLVAENCFKYPARRYNKYTAIKLVNGWLRSPGHRVNLLHPGFKKCGMGIITRKGYVYAAHIFTD